MGGGSGFAGVIAVERMIRSSLPPSFPRISRRRARPLALAPLRFPTGRASISVARVAAQRQRRDGGRGAGRRPSRRPSAAGASSAVRTPGPARVGQGPGPPGRGLPTAYTAGSCRRSPPWAGWARAPAQRSGLECAESMQQFKFKIIRVGSLPATGSEERTGVCPLGNSRRMQRELPVRS